MLRIFPVWFHVSEGQFFIPEIMILASTYMVLMIVLGLPSWLSSKEFTCNAGGAGDAGLFPGWGRSPGGAHGNPLEYSCLKSPMDRGAWQAMVHRVTKSWTQLKGLSMHAHVMVLTLF